MTVHYVNTIHGVVATEAEGTDIAAGDLYLSRQGDVETETFFRSGTWSAYTTDKDLAKQWGWKE